MRTITNNYTTSAEEIKSRLNITDIISEYVKLIRRGRSFWGICPFHDEKTPSFSVNSEKGYYYCFGCHVGGDIFSFVMKFYNIDFRAAHDLLATKAGFQVNCNLSHLDRQRIYAEKERRDLKKQIVKQLNEAIMEEIDRLIEIEMWTYSILRTVTSERDLNRYTVAWAIKTKDKVAAALDELLLIADPLDQVAVISFTRGWQQWPRH